jgi:hypothetical protein
VDQIDVVGHAHVTVCLHRDASNQDIFDLVILQRGEDALRVERSLVHCD